MHDYPCVTCGLEVCDNHAAVACESCHSWCHIACGTGITLKQYKRTLVGDNCIEWKCSNCLSALSNEKMISIDENNPNEVSILGIITLYIYKLYSSHTMFIKM